MATSLSSPFSLSKSKEEEEIIKMAAMVGNDVLPEDVMLSVLSRLPVKTLKRFSCVCKSWFATFQNPDFIRNHYITNTITGSNRKIVVQTQARQFDDFFLSSKPTLEIREKINLSSSIHNFMDPQMVGECEGLICLYDGFSFTFQSVALFNPATRQFNLLPQSVAKGLVYAFSLGFDYQTNDYKVLRFLRNYTEISVELYYLSTNSWRWIHFPSELKEQYARKIRSRLNVYFNGCCHWLMEETKVILAFDMSQEVFQTMLLPAHLLLHKCTRITSRPSLRVFDGYLALFVRPDNVRDCFEIYVMKKYGVTESWTKQLVVGPILGLHNIFGSWRSGDQWFITAYDIDTYSYPIKLYDTSTNVVKDLGTCSFCLANIVIFTENLLPFTGR